MPHPLSSVRITIDRAKKHLRDLDDAIRAFERRESHFVSMKTDPHFGYEIYCFREREPIPGDWGAIVGDCVHNLRSALDHLAVALVKQNGGKPTKYTSFPIGSDASYFASSGIFRIKGASTRAIELVSGLKPYKGGYDALVRLHDIDVADKHLLLIPVARAQKTFTFKHGIVQIGTERYPPTPELTGPPIDRKFPLKDGDELLSYNRAKGPDIDDNTYFKFGFEIAFGEGQIFDGEAVVPTLTQLIDQTEGVVAIFAKEIFSLAEW
jgi:hypothetical protein